MGGAVPVLAPPPVTPVQAAFTDSSPRFNPFDLADEPVAAVVEHQSALPIGRTLISIHRRLYNVIICSKRTNGTNRFAGNTPNPVV